MLIYKTNERVHHQYIVYTMFYSIINDLIQKLNIKHFVHLC